MQSVGEMAKGPVEAPRKGRFSEAVLVAAATALAYRYSVEYECAYLEYFGVPKLMTEISLTTVLHAMTAIITFFLLGITFLLSVDCQYQR